MTKQIRLPGNPQHSLTWQFIGPILAENYTVIAPDNRGAGDSSVPPDNNYTAQATAQDLKGVLDFLNITSTYVVGFDKGVGFATALAIQEPDTVKRLALAEYVLPGFTYEASAAPAPFWDLYQNWQLAFFQVTDLAEALMRDREREFLQWYFYHGSYSGGASFSEDTVSQYVSAISKPGFLRAMLGPFSATSVYEDGKFFSSSLNESKLDVPLLGMGGEASLGSRDALEGTFSPISSNLELDIIPKAGHWIGKLFFPRVHLERGDGRIKKRKWLTPLQSKPTKTLPGLRTAWQTFSNRTTQPCLKPICPA